MFYVNLNIIMKILILLIIILKYLNQDIKIITKIRHQFNLLNQKQHMGKHTILIMLIISLHLLISIHYSFI